MSDPGRTSAVGPGRSVERAHDLAQQLPIGSLVHHIVNGSHRLCMVLWHHDDKLDSPQLGYVNVWVHGLEITRQIKMAEVKRATDMLLTAMELATELAAQPAMEPPRMGAMEWVAKEKVV